MRLPWLDPHNDSQPFPDPGRALSEPDGLLAVGGNLSPSRLLRAYRMGIFPWYSADQPILWWSPDPRLVLFPDLVRISRSLRKSLRKNHFSVTADTAFAAVIDACAAPRDGASGTWITPEMNQAYCQLHQLGHAHSIEIGQQSELVGGLYGVAMGQVFYGESMFSRISDASKVALVVLATQLQRWNFALIDCQATTDHLLSMGALEIPRSTFLKLLKRYCPQPNQPNPWRLDLDLLDSLFASARSHE